MTDNRSRVLSVVVCGAGPAKEVGRLVSLSQQRGWTVQVIATPAALEFFDAAVIEQQTGNPVKSQYGKPGSSRSRIPDAIVVAPATYNTINKWANGISDTYALGVLAEITGMDTPIAVLPFVNSALASRLPFRRSVESLRHEGVRILLGPGQFEPHQPRTGDNRIETYPWHLALDEAEHLLNPACHLEQSHAKVISMSPERDPFAALHEILALTGYLLLDFDGPICSLFAATPTTPVADRLRKIITQENVHLTQTIENTYDWFEILAFATSVSPDLGARVEVTLTGIELVAAATATPAPYIHDVIAACRESARPAAVVSNNSAASIHAYLERHDLSNYIRVVAARTGHDPVLLKPSPHLIQQAVNALGAEPGECTLVGDSTTDIKAAQSARISSIGYAKEPGMRNHLIAAGAGAIITTLADLALKLRAHPPVNLGHGNSA